MGGSVISALTCVTSTPRQPFNLIISNVPAATRPLYWNGAKMTDVYPLSMIMEGQAVPHLQRLLGHIDTGLSDPKAAN